MPDADWRIDQQIITGVKDRHSEIPWRAIRGMRNVVAHEYGKIDVETVWETAESGTKELKEFCQRELNNDVSYDIQLQGF